MKKLTTEELHFLMSKDGVVTLELWKGWLGRLQLPVRETTLEKEYDEHKSFKKGYLFSLVVMIGAALGSLYAVYANETIFPQWWACVIIIPPMVITSIYFIWKAYTSESALTLHINALQEKLKEHGRKEIRGMNYYINRPWPWLLEEVEWILSTLAEKLKRAEHEEGTDSSFAMVYRKYFKECHAVFVSFSLCEEGQGKWLEKKVHIATPQEERVGMMA